MIESHNINSYTVLIIDDDKELCALMKKCVEQENLSAVVAYGGLDGLRLLEENKDSCSLIILDVMMPDMDGFQVLQKIREKNNVPVLMLTAKSDEEDKVSGLRLGADDYLTKPFSMEIHHEHRRVLMAGREVQLNHGEYSMLYCMASSPGQVFSKTQLYAAAWGEEYLHGTTSVENTIWRLRKKLKDEPTQSIYIKTVVGSGYKIDVIREDE